VPLLGPSTDFASAPALPAPSARTGRPRLVDINTKAFRTLDVAAAYWLGFIFADGHVSAQTGRWELVVHLAEVDRRHIEELRELVGGTIGRTSTGSRLRVCSRALVEDLVSLGVYPRKSTRCGRPPVLDGEPRRAFLRGLFDGDGCLHLAKGRHPMAAFCGRPEIVDWFVREVSVSPVSFRDRGVTRYAQWSSSTAARALATFLYGGPGPRLARKAALAEAF